MPMKTAVLGLGFMGATHIKALGGIAGAKLAAVFDVDETRLTGDLSAVQGNIGGPAGMLDFSGVRKFNRLDALLADREIEAVDICLPTHLHTQTAVAALRAGKHVLVEKPMALDGAAADRMVEEAGQSGRIFMTAQVLRFLPPYIALREAASGGRLGRMRAATFRRRCAAPAWGGWLKDPAASGGGAFDLLIHDTDMCLHLFGGPEAVSATGFEDAAAGLDCLYARLRYPGGATVLIEGGWHHPGAYPFTMEYSVVLDGGTVEFNSAGCPPVLYRPNAPAEALDLKRQDGYAAEIAYFVECCLAGRQPEVCPPRESADAVKLMRLMLEARGRNGEAVECRL
jgi:predicted dehydrogenase